MQELPKRKPLNIVPEVEELSVPQARPVIPISEQTVLEVAPEAVVSPTPLDNTERCDIKQDDEDAHWEELIAAAKNNPPPPPPILEQTPEAVTIAALKEEIVRIQEAARKKDEVVAPSKEKTPEEIKEEAIVAKAIREKEIAEKNKASAYLYTDLGTDVDLDAAFARAMQEDEREESEKTKNPTDYITGLSICTYLGLRNKQHRLLAKFIDELTDTNKTLQTCIHELRLAKITPQIGGGATTGPKKLSGAAAMTAVISRQHGMYRIQLYNSGFWISVRPPTLVLMNNFIQTIDNDFQELGRILGGFYHHISGVFIKQKFAEILPQLIVSSNFDKYKDTDELLKNISFQDYETILWALCCLMYRDGIGMAVYCTNPDCKHMDKSQFVDLSNACYLNTDAFNPKAIEWMIGGMNKTRTTEDLKQYREVVLGFTRKIEVDAGANVYSLAVPSIYDYLQQGTALIGKIAANTNGDKNIKTEVVLNQITFHLYKMMAPWVAGLTMNDEHKNVLYFTEDVDAIYESLDMSKYDSTELYEKIENFIRDTRISYFSLTTLQCPSCGTKTNVTKSKLFPLDVEYVFFCLSCLQLEQIGAAL